MNEKKKIPVVRYLCYLLVVTILFTGVTFSRYTMTTSGNSSAPLSRFHCTYTVDDISSTSYPNVNYWLNEGGAASTARSIRYSISNVKDNVISDVDVQSHLRLYMPAEMANNLAFQIGTVDAQSGTITSYTPEIVLPELIFKKSQDTAGEVTVDRKTYATHTNTQFNTADFKDYYDSSEEGGGTNLTGTQDERLLVNGTLDTNAANRTLTVQSEGVPASDGSLSEGSGLRFTVSASSVQTRYSLGFQRGETENDYAPQLFLLLESETDFYTIDITLPSMLLESGVEQSRQYIVYLTLTDRIESEEFDSYWTGVDEKAATLAKNQAGKNVGSNDELITAPPASEDEWYTYNGAKVLGFYFDQTANHQGKETETTVRVQCTYTYKEDRYEIVLYHVAPIGENSTANYAHPIDKVSGEITFGPISETGQSDSGFTGNFTEGTCSQHGEDIVLDLQNITADPFLNPLADETSPTEYTIYHVLSKSYQVSFTALFVQASQSGV